MALILPGTATTKKKELILPDVSKKVSGLVLPGAKPVVTQEEQRVELGRLDLGMGLGLGEIKTTTPAMVAPAPSVIATLGKEVGQSIMRNIASLIGSEVLEPVVKPIMETVAKVERKSPTFKYFTEELATRLYGDLSLPEVTELTGEARGEQIMPIGERVIAMEDRLEKQKNEYKELLKTPGLSANERIVVKSLSSLLENKNVAPLIIGAYTGIDVTLFGGGQKGVLRAFKAAIKLDDAIKVLAKLGLSDDLVKHFAPEVVKVKSDKMAKALFEAISNAQLTSKVAKVTPKIAPKAPEAIKEAVLAEKGIIPKVAEITKLPAVIRGETFVLGETGQTVKTTAKEMKNYLAAEAKVAKLEIKQQKVREEAIGNINRFRGNTDNIIENLKSRHLSDEDIANVVLEDGTKLTDTAKIKRNPDKSLAAVIKKSEIEDIAKNYADEVPKQKWEQKSILVEGAEIPIKMAKSIELPYVWFQRKGLTSLYDPIIQAGRDAEVMKNLFIDRFKDADLFKGSGWFTADRFNLSKVEAESIGKYYLARQGKGYNVVLTDLSPRAQKFVEIFDGIIKETEPRFFETAKLNGKTPGVVANYAPIMTSKDIKLIDQGGSMDWLFRNHPAFFSLKERAIKVPVRLYELDYRNVASRWLDGITDFLNYGETTPKLKYLINSDQLKNIVKESDWQYISNWLKDITTPSIPTSVGGQAVTGGSRILRKGVAMGTLGLNYASVLKQALTQIPIMVIEKVTPKVKSQYAKAFGIDVSKLASITKRRGDIAIIDLQGKIGRTFTGPLTKFDKMNAQASLNALLDKELSKFLEEGRTLADVTPEVQRMIEKKTMDAIDMWYGGFFKGQRPEAFREELGNFILMFLYPLTSQLNGFYRHILLASKMGTGKTIIAGAEVLAAATVIAYMEQVIENLSPKWSDVIGMTKDTLVSLSGNIPLVSQIVWAIATGRDMQISPVIGNLNTIIRNISKGEYGKAGWAIAETFGIPKQIRRIKEGMEIMEAGGITDDDGKMLVPVQGAMELIRSFLRGKYGSIAAQDWLRNIGEKSEDRRWFVPEVEFLQNGDYERKAELYKQFDAITKKELYNFLSEAQQKKLDDALGGKGGSKLNW